MTTQIYPDSWGAGDKVKVAISKNGGDTWLDLEPIVSSIKWNPGKKGIDQIITVDTGRIEKNVPQEMCSMEFDAYWTGMDTTSGSTNIGPSVYFNTTADISTASTRYVLSSSGRNKFVVALLYTTDTTCGGANHSTLAASTTVGYRIMMNNARMTEMSWSYDDHIGKGSFKFECPGFTKAQVPNYSEEDTVTTGGALPWFSTSANVNARFSTNPSL